MGLASFRLDEPSAVPSAPPDRYLADMKRLDLSETEVTVLRRMTPAQKLAVMQTLIRQAYELKAAGIRASQPDLPEEDVWAQTRTLVGGDRP